MRRRVRGYEWALLALITAAAAALRLIDIGQVETDPFYDAAVRSMGLSWHNFFFGAFEPGASVSIDKPPVDLWLQVATVKLFGFTSTTLKLPEAISGIVAVPVLFLAVRRMWSATAGLAAALALAVLPVDVITSRSDTMDGVMALLIVLALLFVVRACETGRTRWLLAGAAVLGIAFDVKILESLVALPGLGLLALLGFPGSPRARALKLAAAAAVYVVVALAWLGATLLAPASDRPWAIGSTNGSAWNAVFVFNGTERLGGKSPEPQFTQYEPGHKYPVATQSERDHIPITPPSPTRLLARIGPLSGQRLGMELLVGLLLGIPALVWSVRRRRGDSDEDEDEDEDDEDMPSTAPAAAGGGEASGPGDAPEGAHTRRVRIAIAAGLALWLLTGIVLFSHMARLHPRYVEGLVPAVAAALGLGAAWAAQPRGVLRPAALAITLAVAVYYGERLEYGT
ncbi:MAG TPA: glycosyltransferase family 39 protein, partial [Solirubrobacteraceae bacterium]